MPKRQKRDDLKIWHRGNRIYKCHKLNESENT